MLQAHLSLNAVSTQSTSCHRCLPHKPLLLLGTPSQVVEFSSYVGTAQRAAHLARFKSGSATVLVASDAMTRGMDVEHVANVINYDAPVYVKTYVHR